MAYLNLSTIEPVNFGGRECVPEIDAELKLRLSQINKFDDKAYKVIASAFPNDEKYVLDFMKRMATIDIQKLQVYLIGGPTMVEAMLEAMSSTTQKKMDTVLRGGE